MHKLKIRISIIVIQLFFENVPGFFVGEQQVQLVHVMHQLISRGLLALVSCLKLPSLLTADVA